MLLAVLLFLSMAIAPCGFMLYFVYAKDRYEPEPLGMVLRVYFVSFLAVLPAAILEAPLFFTITTFGAYTGFGIGLIEEVIKYLFLRWLALHSPEFNEPFDGIVYAVSVSLGFATVENVLYVVGAYFSGEFLAGTIVLRALLTVPLHALLGVMMGSYIGRAKFAADGPTRQGLLWRGVIFPSVGHGVFDFFIFAAMLGNAFSLIGALLVVLLLWVIGLNMIRSAQRASPFQGKPKPVDP